LLLATGCSLFERDKRDRDDANLPARTSPDRRTVDANPPPRSNSPSRSQQDLDDLRARADDPNANLLKPTSSWGNDNNRSDPPRGSNRDDARLQTPSTNTVSSRPTNTGNGSSRVRTFEEAQQFLMARGVKWQQLQTSGEGEWRFSCTLPTKPGSSTMRTYEQTDRYGLIAMQKVIDQIVRDQGR
jgi:hypothetical protein